MTLKSRIDEDIKQAMRQKNKSELTTLRAIKSMILLAETEKGKVGSIDELTETKLLMKAAKQRKESADIFKKENREELFKKEMEELEIINRYLPKPFSQEELLTEIKKIITSLNASTPQDMGKVIGLATKTLAGKAAGKDISETVKQLLSS